MWPRVDYYVATVCWFDPILNILDDFWYKNAGAPPKQNPTGLFLRTRWFSCCLTKIHVTEGKVTPSLQKFIDESSNSLCQLTSKLAGHTANLHGTRLYVFGGTCSGKCLGYDNLRPKEKGETWLGEVNSVQWTAGILTPRKLRWQDGKSPLVYRRYIDISSKGCFFHFLGCNPMVLVGGIQEENEWF